MALPMGTEFGRDAGARVHSGEPPAASAAAHPFASTRRSEFERCGSRMLSPTQIEAIRSAMRLFVDDDLARGAGARAKLYCDACQSARPGAGFIQYERYGMCNVCATEFEVARARGQIASAGQYVRDKRFGEGALYELSD